jgi:hypothetical protein
VARVNDAAPARASLDVESHLEVRSGSRSVESRCAGALRSNAGKLYFDVTCTILENGRQLRAWRWQDQAPRLLL